MVASVITSISQPFAAEMALVVHPFVGTQTLRNWEKFVAYTMQANNA